MPNYTLRHSFNTDTEYYTAHVYLTNSLDMFYNHDNFMANARAQLKCKCAALSSPNGRVNIMYITTLFKCKHKGCHAMSKMYNFMTNFYDILSVYNVPNYISVCMYISQILFVHILIYLKNIKIVISTPLFYYFHYSTSYMDQDQQVFNKESFKTIKRKQ